MHFSNPESTYWAACRCFNFVSIQTPQQLCPLAISSLKNTCFQKSLCTETVVGEFAISLVLVISCEPVKVETESRNFSAQHVYKLSMSDGNEWHASLFQNSGLHAEAHRRFDWLGDQQRDPISIQVQTFTKAWITTLYKINTRTDWK